MRAIQDGLLTNVSRKLVPQGMISRRLLTPLTVVQDSGKIGKHGKQHLRIHNSVIGGKGQYPQVDIRVYSTDSYEIEEHGLMDVVTPKDYRNVQLPFDAERDTTMGLTTSLELGSEKSLADTLTNSSIITQYTTLSGDGQFSSYDTSDPIAVFDAGKAAVLAGCGFMPNVLAMDILVWNKLKYHPQLFDRLGFKYNQSGPLSVQNIADALEFERVEIAQCRYNSAKQGQTDALSAVWGKHIVMLKVANQAAVDQTTCGYQLSLASVPRLSVSKAPSYGRPGATDIFVSDNYDNAILDVGAAYLVKDAVA